MLTFAHWNYIWGNVHFDLSTHFIHRHSCPLTLSLIIVYGYNLLHWLNPPRIYLPTSSKDWPLSACIPIWVYVAGPDLRTFKNEKTNNIRSSCDLLLMILTKMICICNLIAERCSPFPSQTLLVKLQQSHTCQCDTWSPSAWQHYGGRHNINEIM